MPYAMRIHTPGGPDAMVWEELPTPIPGPGEVRLRHGAVGLNYIDVYHRTGAYPLPSYPVTLGLEGAGTVDALGAGVTSLAVGDRVAYAGGPIGAYSEVRCIPADRLVTLPTGITFETAAAMMLQGMTVEYLLRRTYKVQRGDTILVHAAAGGVGLILCQWAKHLGATVIGTVGSKEKAELARAHGCDHPIVYTDEDFVARVKALTNGEGVPVVYDSVGKDTFDRSLQCLRPLGLMCLFGAASGPVPAFDLGKLAALGSLYITRPTLMTYTAKRADLVASATALFDVVLSGAVKIEVRQRYPLKDAARAHRDLEGRKTTGSTVFLV